jgi:hypothetical protein
MKLKFRSIIAVILTGIWVNASEFFRNEVLLKRYWVDHYKSLGMTFSSETLNGIVWVVWGFLSGKFNLLQTTMVSWFVAFVLMWLVTWNLNVLPVAILSYAVPLSLLESFIGSYICTKISSS